MRRSDDAPAWRRRVLLDGHHTTLEMRGSVSAHELASELGAAKLWLDGAELAGDAAVGPSDLAVGAQLDTCASPATGPRGVPTASSWALEVLTGPAAGTMLPLHPGRHVVTTTTAGPRLSTDHGERPGTLQVTSRRGCVEVAARPAPPDLRGVPSRDDPARSGGPAVRPADDAGDGSGDERSGGTMLPEPEPGSSWRATQRLRDATGRTGGSGVRRRRGPTGSHGSPLVPIRHGAGDGSSAQPSGRGRRADRRSSSTPTGPDSLTGVREGVAAVASLDGVPVTDTVPWQPGAVLWLGPTALRLVERSALDHDGSVATDGRRAVRPRPAVPVEAPATAGAPTVDERPTPTAPTLSLATLLVPAVLGIVLAVVVDPRLALFVLLGPLVTLGSWGEGRGRARRGARAAERAQRDATVLAVDRLPLAAAAASARARHRAPDPPAVVQALHTGDGLWTSPPADTLALRIGLAAGPAVVAPDALDPLARAIADQHRWRPDVPAVVELQPGALLAFEGQDAAARRQVVASLLLTAAAAVPPSSLSIEAVADAAAGGRPSLADVVCWLPHATGSSRFPMADRRLVVVDLADADDRESAVHAAVESGAVVVTTGPVEPSVPDHATVRLQTDGTVRVAGPDQAPGAAPVVPWSPTLPHAVRLAARAARWRERDGALASGVQRADDVPSSTGTVLHRWQRVPGAAEGGLSAPLGTGPDGTPVQLDLVADGPHALVAGTTGSGKSVLLRRWLLGLALEHAPDDLGLVLVDFKGGAAFDELAELPHVAGAVTNLDGGAARLVTALGVEVRRREQALREHGAPDVGSLDRSTTRRLGLRRLVVVVDEFAALATEHASAMDALVDVAQRGRSLGLHLVLATQRPAGVVNDRIRANTDLRVCLRVTDAADSSDVVDVPDAASIDPDRPGTALVRRAGRPLEQVRVDHLDAAWTPPRPVRVVCGAEDVTVAVDAPTLLRVGVGVARAAWARCGRLIPAAVLAPDLPSAADLDWPPHDHDTTEPTAGLRLPIGTADDLPNQRRTTLGWTGSDGALLLLGGSGSRLDRALVGVADGALRAAAEVHALDGDGAIADLSDHPGVGTVAGVEDVATQQRLFARLHRVLDAREQTGHDAPADPVLLVLHRLDVLWERLSTTQRLGDRSVLLDLLARGPAHGVHVVASTRRATGLGASLAAHVAERVVLRMDDDVEHAAAGLAWGSHPPAEAGRGVHVRSGLVVQLPLPSTPNAPVLRAAPRLDAVEATVALDALPAPRANDEGLWLPLGLDLVHLDVAGLAPAPGEHVLVAGPRRSGRSSALALLAEQVLAARPGTRLVAWGPPRSPWSRHPRAVETAALVEEVRQLTGPTLLVLDDAERLDVAGLDAAVAAADDGLLVAAAAEPRATRGLFGHVLQVVQRARTSVLLQPTRDDLEALGVRGVVPPADRLQGRGLLLSPDGTRPVQLAGAAVERVHGGDDALSDAA